MDTNDRFNDTTKNSSDNADGISHTLDIIKAAFPYLDSQTQQTMGLVLKTGELFESIQSISQEGSVTSLSIQKHSIDIEALLNGIRDVCNQKEREFVDIILNIFKAKNFYHTYTTLTAAMASQSDNSNPSGDTNSTANPSNLDGMFGMNGNSNMMEVLESFLTPEQKDTFDNLNMMFSVMQ